MKDYRLVFIEVLPSDYREQKSREQSFFQDVARFDPSLAKQGQVFKDICVDHKVELVYDPYLIDWEDRYG